MALPVKDADFRATVLQKFYDERHVRSWIELPASANATEQEIKITYNICRQLYQAGLIEWKGLEAAVRGMGRITNLGVDVIEENIPAPIAISIDRSISISSSNLVQIGDSNTQNMWIDSEKIVAAINDSTATATEKENAKSIFQKVLESPLLSKIIGLSMGSG